MKIFSTHYISLLNIEHLILHTLTLIVRVKTFSKKQLTSNKSGITFIKLSQCQLKFGKGLKLIEESKLEIGFSSILFFIFQFNIGSTTHTSSSVIHSNYYNDNDDGTDYTPYEPSVSYGIGLYLIFISKFGFIF